MNFKNLGEQKKQIENALKINKAIENLVIHSKNDFFECYIDYQFRIFNLKYIGSEDIIRNYISDCGFVEDCINKAILKMQKEITIRTHEVLNSRPGGR